MPDEYGFNYLGDNVRCIDCPTGGPIWRWPEHKRARHGRTHGTEPKPGAADVRRMRILLAAPPTQSNEEKEAITMANKATGKGEPAKQVAIDVLRKAGEPLHAKEIAKRVLASGRCAGLKGKTPEATISAMLAVGSKPGGPFARVDKGTYTVADTASTTVTKTQRPTRAVAKPKPTPTRKKAPAAKATSRTRTKRAAAKPSS
jgi:HB1, ASXL, restriction endonuclease HTH domain